MARDYEGRVAFVGVGAFDTPDAMEDFVERHGLGHMPHAVSEDGALFVHYGLTSQPAWVLLDPDGEAVLQSTRPSMRDVEGALEALADG